MRTVVVVELSLMVERGRELDDAILLAQAMTAHFEDTGTFAGLIRFDEQLRPPNYDNLAHGAAGRLGANIETAIRAALDLLAGPGRLVLISSLTPTAHSVPGARWPYFAFPPSEDTLLLTRRAVEMALRQNVVIEALRLGHPDEHSTALSEQITAAGGLVSPVMHGDTAQTMANYLAAGGGPPSERS